MTVNRRAGYTWAPTEEYVANANVTRLARTHGIGSLAELRHRSVADIGWYWDAVVRDLGLPFRTPYTQVVDLSAGIEHPDWFTGGELNVVDACLTRWARAAPDRPAVVHEAEDGTTRTLTFGELDDQVARLAAGLRGLGVGRGDAVALYLPMIPAAVVALYAVARLGAVLVPLFSGFARGRDRVPATGRRSQGGHRGGRHDPAAPRGGDETAAGRGPAGLPVGAARGAGRESRPGA